MADFRTPGFWFPLGERKIPVRLFTLLLHKISIASENIARKILEIFSHSIGLSVFRSEKTWTQGVFLVPLIAQLSLQQSRTTNHTQFSWIPLMARNTIVMSIHWLAEMMIALLIFAPCASEFIFLVFSQRCELMFWCYHWQSNSLTNCHRDMLFIHVIVYQRKSQNTDELSKFRESVWLKLRTC